MPVALEKLLLDDAPEAIVASTEDGTIVFWNRAAEALFGHARAAALGRNLEDLVVPAERVAEAREARARTLSAGAAFYESVRRRKDGSPLYVGISSRAWRDPSGRLCVLSTETDITDVRASRDAQRVASRFSTLIESMPDGIVVVNLTGRIVYTNRQAEDLFGYARGELLGKAVEVLLPERFRRTHVGHRAGYFGQLRTRAMGAGLELRGRRRDDTEFPVEISLSPLAVEDGTLAVSAIRDVTDRRKIESTLQEKNEELARAIEAKDRFLATMSHELRTPLNAIIGFTGTLLMKLPGPLNEEQEKQLQTVQSNGRHLLSLINDLLDLARIEAGKVELGHDRIACRAVLEEVAASLRPQAAAKGLELRMELPPSEIELATDRRALAQILLNLATNAIKFTETGGVTLALARSRPGRVRFTVADTGVGIAAEDQARLFEEFMQVGAHERRVGGTGLGLHLSRRLAELLGGRIAFASEPGRGSRFEFEVPEG
jgi:PAS domain S-box-containing protein